MLQLVLEQLPGADLHREIFARTDIGGHTHAFTSDCRSAGIRFSVGYEVDERVRGAIDRARCKPTPAALAEFTDRVDLSNWPEGTPLICRRALSPGAQPSVFNCEAGYRHTAFITDQIEDDIAALGLRHRRWARVEDAIRVATGPGCAACPSPRSPPPGPG